MRSLLVLLAVMLITFVAYPQKKKAGQKDPLVTADSLFASGDYKAAVPLYVGGLKQPAGGANAQPWFRLGYSYHKLKDYPKALDAYRNAEKINPRHPGLRVNMAKAYSASGDVGTSMVAIDSAMRAGFGNYKLLDSDPDFENLRKSEKYSELRARVYLASNPCENLPAARAFDFWIGEWDVYQTSNPAALAGFNKITRESGGCVIMENWESQAAHSGLSLNYYDPANGKWKQKWAGSGQDIMEFYDGELVGNVMRFKYDIVNPDGSITPGKLEFTNLEPGVKVQQHFMSSPDAGKTWQTVYDFTYVRRKS